MQLFWAFWHKWNSLEHHSIFLIYHRICFDMNLKHLYSVNRNTELVYWLRWYVLLDFISKCLHLLQFFGGYGTKWKIHGRWIYNMVFLVGVSIAKYEKQWNPQWKTATIMSIYTYQFLYFSTPFCDSYAEIAPCLHPLRTRAQYSFDRFDRSQLTAMISSVLVVGGHAWWYSCRNLE